MNGLHSMRGQVEFCTPTALFIGLDHEFNFTLDPCSTHENALCRKHYTKAEDGLTRDWEGAVFMNPPYSECAAWVKKARLEALRGATVVGLLPARTDTAWWHADILGVAEVRFLRGRLRFRGARYNAPFPCVVVIWRLAGVAPTVERGFRKPTGGGSSPSASLRRK